MAVTVATAFNYARLPFIKRNFEFADREGSGDRDAVLGTIAVVPSLSVNGTERWLLSHCSSAF